MGGLWIFDLFIGGENQNAGMEGQKGINLGSGGLPWWVSVLILADFPSVLWNPGGGPVLDKIIQIIEKSN